jgi:hypothetical protein
LRDGISLFSYQLLISTSSEYERALNSTRNSTPTNVLSAAVAVAAATQTAAVEAVAVVRMASAAAAA